MSPSFEREAKVSCNGNIDSINGVSANSLDIQSSKSLEISGWLALSAENGVVFDKIFITLTGHDEKKLFMTTDEQYRPDVAAAFKLQELSAAGFHKKAFLPSLNGKYTLGLAGIRGAELYSCSQFSIPLIVK